MSKTYKGVGGIDLPNEEFPAKITKGYYRVLEEKADNAAELGAYKLLANAIKTCDSNPGSVVVADAGICIYPEDDTELVIPDEPVDPTDHADPDEPGGDVPGGDPADDPADPDDPGSDELGDEPGDDPADPDNPDDPTDPDDPGDDPSELTDPTDPDDPKVEVTGQARLVTLMNIRSEPSMNASILGRLPAGSIVNILALEGDWLKIVWEGTEDGAAYVLYQDGKYAEMQ